MLGKRLIKSNDAGGGGCTNTVDLYNPFPDGGGVALYQLNGDATDVSGNYNGTATDVTYGAGQFGQAGVFNGSSSKILASVPKSSSQSFSFWTKHGTQSNSTATYLGYSNTASNGFFSLCISSGNFSILYWNGTTYARNTSTTSITDNTWHHVVLNTVGNVFTIYLDGNSTPVYTTTLSGFTHATRSDLQISFETPDGAASYFNGSIDQVRIFNRALRPYEVEALYTEEYCTPTIVPSEHFNTVTYTGNGGTNAITGVGFQPDLTWIKQRNGTASHSLQDSVRGAGQNFNLYSDNTAYEGQYGIYGYLSSFDINGFTVNAASGSHTNASGTDYVSWNFKAGGAAVTNTDGTITSQVSANTEAGFSIVSWTGNGVSGQSIGHGLNEVPSMIIHKRRLEDSPWEVYHSSLGKDLKIQLNLTNASSSSSAWANTNPTSTVYYAGAYPSEMIAYCFAEVEGFSNFGSYVGTGTTSGPTVITGFEPAFIVCKRSNSTGNWVMLDNKRVIENPKNKALFANLSNAEDTGYSTDFLENGFQIKDSGSDLNTSGGSYIYMAFAADPTAVEPTLEDSFNTVLWTGDGTSNRAITGVGFQPDFIWTKCRSLDWHNVLADSVRGFSTVDGDVKYLSSEITNAEYERDGLRSFDPDGFTIDTYPNVNDNNQTFVAWAWKGAEIPAINSNGSIPSVVSANPAAGFSIVSFTSNGAGGTIGHGLDVAPDVVIWKNRSAAETWWFQHTILDGSDDYLKLNETVFNQNVSAGWVNSLTSTTIKDFTTATNGQNVIAYCFAEVAGFSKFGSYTGTGVTDNFVSTSVNGDAGFEPAFLLVKQSSSPRNWYIVDNKRNPSNPKNRLLMPNLSDAEFNGVGDVYFDFNSNGFTVTAAAGVAVNQLNETYIYMAFANQF